MPLEDTLPEGFEYVEIEPTIRNAIAVQALTYDDLCTRGFDPRLLADPLNADMLEVQVQKLQEHPERYIGVMYDGQLVAFIKENWWLISDELPFVSGPRALWLKARRAFRQSRLFGRPWGIFGLVVSAGLDYDIREEILTSLLQRSLENAGPRAVYIVVAPHMHSMLPRVLQANGFIPVGEPGEAAGAPGIVQQRYRRPAG